jgi:hypothetical protein
VSDRFGQGREGTKAAAITRTSSRHLLSLPVRLHGIALGRPVDLILRPAGLREVPVDGHVLFEEPRAPAA